MDPHHPRLPNPRELILVYILLFLAGFIAYWVSLPHNPIQMEFDATHRR